MRFPMDVDRSKLARGKVDRSQKLRDHHDDIVRDLEAMEIARDVLFGTLTVRSSDSVGQVTINAGQTPPKPPAGRLVSVYWIGPNGARLKMTVGTVDGDNYPVTGGVGDVLPAQGTVVTMVHFETVAEAWRFMAEDNPHPTVNDPVDPNQACLAYHEEEAYKGAVDAALSKLTAQYRQ